MTVEQACSLLKIADEFGLLGYAVLALFAGIRPQEVLRLDWSNVHDDDRLIVIDSAASKIHERREIPISETLNAWLTQCRRGSGPVMDQANFRGRFPEWRKAAGMQVWPHDVLRHTFATYHVAAFKNPAETARQMGHIGGLRMLYKHYAAYVSERVAKQFWDLRPTIVHAEAALAA